MSEEAIKASNGNRGKMAAQAGHAFLHCFLESKTMFPKKAKAYLDSGTVGKVVLRAPLETLLEIEKKHQKTHGVYLVKDAGLTVFSEPTITCLGVGPITQDECCEQLRSLSVWV